ncbi:hypothetical protein ACO0K9_12340 [Undibacterium sp. Ji50W]|uniref:hypothetical protein n=1 Tax=Undibacterium sp. Ji50W TaxID=3413041 RepID=UPI003BF01B6B
MKHNQFWTALGSVFGAVLLAASLMAAPHASAGWLLTDMGAFSGGTSVARGLTPTGRVAGYSAEADGQLYPFLSSRGLVSKVGNDPGVTLAVNALGQSAGILLGADNYGHVGLFAGQTSTDLGSIDGGGNIATDINNIEQVVGYTILANHDERAFVADKYSLVNLGTLGGRSSRAIAINRASVITGFSTTDTTGGPTHCFVSYGNGMVDIGSLASTGNCIPAAINDAGQIVGTANNGTALHAFLYDGSQFHDLGTLGGNTSAANGINQLGQVVGQAQTANGDRRAFLYSAGKMINLGSPIAKGGSSSANAVNANGQAIGYYILPDDSRHIPILFRNGRIIDLNTVLPMLTEVDAEFLYLNDAGQIAGTGKINGARHAFLLTPVPWNT